MPKHCKVFSLSYQWVKTNRSLKQKLSNSIETTITWLTTILPCNRWSDLESKISSLRLPKRFNFQAFQHLDPITARQVGAGGGFPVLSHPPHIFFKTQTTILLLTGLFLNPLFIYFVIHIIYLVWPFSFCSLIVSLYSPFLIYVTNTLSIFSYCYFLWSFQFIPLTFLFYFSPLLSHKLQLTFDSHISLSPYSHFTSLSLASIDFFVFSWQFC